MHADRVGYMLRLEQQERVEPRALHQALRTAPINRCLAHALSTLDVTGYARSVSV